MTLLKKLRPSRPSPPPNPPPSRGTAEECKIALAAVAGAHGVKGELRLKLFADNAASLAAHEFVFVGGERRRLLAVRDQGKNAVARFEGIGERSAAEGLRGSLVEVDRGQLPPLEEGEYYHADLIGLACADRHGAARGTVIAVENYGAGDLLEIEAGDGKRSLIPFRPGIADWQNGRIVLDPEFLA